MGDFLRCSMKVYKSIGGLFKEFKLRGFSDIKIIGSEKGNIELIMYLEEDYEDSNIQEALEKIKIALSFAFKVKVTEPILLEKKISDKHEISNEMLVAFDVIQESTVKELEQLDEELKLEFDEEISKYYKMFRNSVNQDDILIQYLLLYHILMIIYDDSQNKVDEFILGYYDLKIAKKKYNGNVGPENRDEIRKISEQEASYLQTKEYNNGKKGYETIFSRLRNQIAHKRKDVEGNVITSESTKNTICEYIDEFKEIVAYAIKNEV